MRVLSLLLILLVLSACAAGIKPIGQVGDLTLYDAYSVGIWTSTSAVVGCKLGAQGKECTVVPISPVPGWGPEVVRAMGTIGAAAVLGPFIKAAGDGAGKAGTTITLPSSP